MGWRDTWESIKDWGDRVWQNATLANAVKGVGKYSFKTIKFVLGQPQAAWRAGASLMHHPRVRTLGKHMLQVGTRSLAPIVLIYVNDEIQRRGREYLDDEPDEAWISTNTLVLSSLVVLNSAVWVFAKRQKLQTIGQTAILTLESSNAVADQLPDVKICQDCTTLRFLKGSFRDLITYWSTELLIEIVRYSGGENIATLLSIYHNGRYIVTLVWSPFCGRHLDENLKEHPEFVLAQGLTHAGVSASVAYLIEYGTGIPRTYYQSTIEQLSLVGQVLVAGHNNLPEPVKHSDRLIIDPVGLYEQSVKLSVDVILAGTKVVILPRVKPIVRPLLNSLPQAPSIPWAKMAKLAEDAWCHPATKMVKYCVLPPLLQGQEQFVNDPLVSYHWRELRDKTVDAIIDMEEVSRKYAIRVASTSPETTAEAVEMVMGTPKILTEIVLHLLRNEALMDFLADKRRLLQGIHSGPKPRAQVDPTVPPMRGQVDVPKIIPHPQVMETGEALKPDETEQQGLPTAKPSQPKIPTERKVERKLLGMRPVEENKIQAKMMSRPSFFEEVKRSSSVVSTTTHRVENQEEAKEDDYGFVKLEDTHTPQTQYFC